MRTIHLHLICPAEILQLIIDNLHENAIKTARLVCKYWSTMATPLLLDTVVISSPKIDLDIFTNIKEHSTISRSIRTLVHDVQEIFDHHGRYPYVNHVARTNSQEQVFLSVHQLQVQSS